MSLGDMNVLICGIANERSLAYAAAQALITAGGAVWCTWQGEAQHKRVQRCLKQLGERAHDAGRWDVREDADAQAVVQRLQGHGVRLQGLLHAMAFAQLQDAQGDPQPVHQVDADGWAEAMEVSARSLPMMLTALRPCMAEDGFSAVTLTFHGARQVVPGYNMMGVAKAALEAGVRYCAAELGPLGVRVNAVSAGSVRTVASSNVPGFAARQEHAASTAPLRRGVQAEEVAQAITWLLSAQASGITGATIPVDCGLHVLAP